MARYERSYDGERRTVKRTLQLTPSEDRALTQAADEQGASSWSDYARELLLHRSAAVVAATRRNPEAKALMRELELVGRERLATPRTLAEVDLTAIIAALAAAETEANLGIPKLDRRREVHLEQELAAAKARIEFLEQENRALNSRLADIAALAAGAAPEPVNDVSHTAPRAGIEATPVLRPLRTVASNATAASGDSLRPAARKLLLALAQHGPARFTWGQAATLAGLKPSGGDFNAGRKSLRASVRPCSAKSRAAVTGIPGWPCAQQWADPD
jgi:hypothetical protein